MYLGAHTAVRLYSMLLSPLISLASPQLLQDPTPTYSVRPQPQILPREWAHLYAGSVGAKEPVGTALQGLEIIPSWLHLLWSPLISLRWSGTGWRPSASPLFTPVYRDGKGRLLDLDSSWEFLTKWGNLRNYRLVLGRMTPPGLPGLKASFKKVTSTFL